MATSRYVHMEGRNISVPEQVIKAELVPASQCRTGRGAGSCQHHEWVVKPGEGDIWGCHLGLIWGWVGDKWPCLLQPCRPAQQPFPPRMWKWPPTMVNACPVEVFLVFEVVLGKTWWGKQSTLHPFISPSSVHTTKSSYGCKSEQIQALVLKASMHKHRDNEQGIIVTLRLGNQSLRW